MRRFLSFLVLLAVAAFCVGCGGSNSNGGANTTGTTTYEKPSTTTAPSGGGMAGNEGGKPANTQGPGIKPPTEK